MAIPAQTVTVLLRAWQVWFTLCPSIHEVPDFTVLLAGERGKYSEEEEEVGTEDDDREDKACFPAPRLSFLMVIFQAFFTANSFLHTLGTDTEFAKQVADTLSPFWAMRPRGRPRLSHPRTPDGSAMGPNTSTASPGVAAEIAACRLAVKDLMDCVSVSET